MFFSVDPTHLALKQIRMSVHVDGYDSKLPENPDEEIQIHLTLRDPHVVQMYDWFETPGCMNIVLDLCAGGSLDDLIAVSDEFEFFVFSFRFRQNFCLCRQPETVSSSKKHECGKFFATLYLGFFVRSIFCAFISLLNNACVSYRSSRAQAPDPPPRHQAEELALGCSRQTAPRSAHYNYFSGFRIRFLIICMDGTEFESDAADFGLSKVMENAQFHGTRVSPAYIAPEVSKGQPYSDKADVFSLGVTIYEFMQHVIPPRAGYGDRSIALDRLEFNDCYSQELRSAVKRCLHPDPRLRPSVRELLELPIFQAKVVLIFSGRVSHLFCLFAVYLDCRVASRTICDRRCDAEPS
jgi:serine/threonine protein kinase